MKLELNDIHTMITWVAEQKLSLLEYQDADMRIKIGGQTEAGGHVKRPHYEQAAGEAGQERSGVPAWDAPAWSDMPCGAQTCAGMQSGDVPSYSGVQSGGTQMNPGTQSGGTQMNPGMQSGGTQANPGMQSGVAQTNPGMQSGGTQTNPGMQTGGTQMNPGMQQNAVPGESGMGAAAPVYTIESPLVGTFFAAPSEGAEPYVRVGDTVRQGQIVGIVEAMKLMNEIEADCDGVVEEILVQNESLVEYGQSLMRIREVKHA